jgi:SAM-dependent methyltransferase
MDREVRQQFGASAEHYVKSSVHARGADLAIVVEAAGLRGRESVLDLGTAVGHTAFALAPHAAWVHGVDLTPEMLQQAQRLAADRHVSNVSLTRADVTHLPFSPASFDVATCRYSAHHYADPRQVLREVARVLRPGGRFILADTVAPDDLALDTFINAVELLRDRSHVRDHTVGQWQTMLGNAGFTSEILYAWDVELDFVEWVQRMQAPPHAVTTLRSLLVEAPTPAREEFHIVTVNPLSFCLKGAIIRARLE